MIRLDAAQRPGQDQPASPAYTLYTVQPGDNLWDIALTHLGNGEDWHQIYALNAGLPQPDGERLVLPSLIQPGWILRLPAPATAGAPSGNGHLTGPPAPVTPAAGRTPRPGPEPSAGPHRPVHRPQPGARAASHPARCRERRGHPVGRPDRRRACRRDHRSAGPGRRPAPPPLPARQDHHPKPGTRRAGAAADRAAAPGRPAG